MASNFLQQLHLAKSKQEEYILKLHRISEPGNWFIPEAYFIGPEDFTFAPRRIGAAISETEQTWLNFLEKKVTRKMPAAIAAVTKTVSPITKGITKKHLLYGMGAILLGNFVFNGADPNKLPPLSEIGLSSQQQRILASRANNGFDGMPHGGLGAEQRKLLTDFGSKYDSVRAMAKALGTTFENLTKKPGFRRALRMGKEIEILGEGSYGQAKLFQAEYKGKQFQFVKKQLNITDELKKAIILSKDPEYYSTGLELANEARALRELGKTSASPSLYGHMDEALYMEYMPGQRLSTYIRENPTKELPSFAVNQLRETVVKAAEKGFLNPDIHAGNIMYDPISKRVGMIDWGLARSKIKPPAESEKIMQNELSKTLVVPFAKTSIASQIKRNTVTTVNSKRGVPEGMQHGSMASTKRLIGTDFASPWKGLFGGISRRITKYMGRKAAPGAAKLLNPIKAAKMAEGKSLEEFAKAIGGDIRVLGKTKYTGTPEEIAYKKVWENILIEKKQAAGAFKDFGFINPKELKKISYEFAEQHGIPSDLAKKAIESEDFLKTNLYHELLERQAMTRFPGEARMVQKAGTMFHPFHSVGVQHQAGQVILGEAGFVQATKNKDLIEFYKKLRKTWAERKTFETGLEAFGETGVAPELRKLTTDFGSGYRGLKTAVSKRVAKVSSSSNRTSQKLTESAKDLRIAQEQIWEWGRSGGQGHRYYTGKHVKQLSRFGGGI